MCEDCLEAFSALSMLSRDGQVQMVENKKHRTLFTGAPALLVEHARARGVDLGSTRLRREMIFVSVALIHSKRATSLRMSDRP